MGELRFAEVPTVEPVAPRIGHTITLDIDGTITVACPGVTDYCRAYSRCMCRQARKHYRSDDAPYEFTAHGKHHISDDWDGEYMAENGECWVSEAFDVHPETKGQFIADVCGIPGIYDVRAYDDPAYWFDPSGMTERQYENGGE